MHLANRKTTLTSFLQNCKLLSDCRLYKLRNHLPKSLISGNVYTEKLSNV